MMIMLSKIFFVLAIAFATLTGVITGSIVITIATALIKVEAILAGVVTIFAVLAILFGLLYLAARKVD